MLPPAPNTALSSRHWLPAPSSPQSPQGARADSTTSSLGPKGRGREDGLAEEPPDPGQSACTSSQ